MALDHSGGMNCVVQFLTNIQAIVGTISVSNIMNLFGNITDSDLPTNITCTDCNKAIFNVVNNQSIRPLASVAADLSPALQRQCGASFLSKALSNAFKTQRTDFLGSKMVRLQVTLSKALVIALLHLPPLLLHLAVFPFYRMVLSLVWSSFRPCCCCLETTWSL
jgi:hypothetical protein